MILKDDHEYRPLFIIDTRIILETFLHLSNIATDFLTTIAEPVSRPKLIHEYSLTQYSLYAAVSSGLDSLSILDTLESLSKFHLDKVLINFVLIHTRSVNQARLVIKHASFFIECEDVEISAVLLNDPVIQNARQIESEKPIIKTAEKIRDDWDPLWDDLDNDINDTDLVNAMISFEETDQTPHDLLLETLDPETQSTLLQLDPLKIDQVKKQCSKLSIPLMQEYDLKLDKSRPISIALKPTTKLRLYQQKSLGKIFGNSRARSGIIVLPCGSGKTIVGVAAAATVKRKTVVLCTSTVSVDQWCREFLAHSTIPESRILKFTSATSSKTVLTSDIDIIISTYTMLSFSGKRSHIAQKTMNLISTTEWGFMILDEVHVIPAEMFQKVLGTIPTNIKLGLYIRIT